MVTAAVERAREIGAGLLVVDTFSDWSGLKGDEENSSGAVLEAMRPLQEAAATGLAVVLVIHDRKSGGDLGDSARGSSAIGGVGDILLSLRRANTPGHNTRRTLLAVGRFDDIPSQVVIELRDGLYTSLGNTIDVERTEARQTLADTLLLSWDTAPTETELVDKLGVPRGTVRRAPVQ